MINHGMVQSTIKPKAIDIFDTKVFIASNIHYVTVDDENDVYELYEYEYIEYDKDEYIELLQNRTSNLEALSTDIQTALVEIYESLI